MSLFAHILADKSDSAAPLLGGINTFWILIAIAIGSTVAEWWKKRKQPGQTDSSLRDPSSPPAPPQPTAPSDWEEELRRLLGGEPPVTKPPPVAAPPPLRPVIIHEPAKPISIGVVSLPAAQPVPSLAEPVFVHAEKSVAVSLPALQESITAYQRASHLHEEVAGHLRRVEEMTHHHVANVPTALHQAPSAESVQTISMIRNPNTARQAIIASLILGPPKALAVE